MGLCIRKQDVDFSSVNVPLRSLTSQLLWGQAAAAGKSGCMVPSCGPGTGLSSPRPGTPRLVDPGSGPREFRCLFSSSNLFVGMFSLLWPLALLWLPIC